MFASLLGLNTSPSDPSSIVQVKVRNLNKATSREDLRNHLSQFNVLDIKLIRCSRANKVNYAYIHLPNHGTAARMVQAIHNRMEIHGNVLKAIVKEDPTASNRENTSENMDNNLLEIFFYNSEVSSLLLKRYFEKYGEVESVTIVKQGSPSVCHIRYTTALSAYVARHESPHCIENTNAVALPLLEQLESQCDFQTESFPCDPLVTESVKTNLLERFHDKSQVEWLSTGNCIIGHFRVEMSTAIQRYARMVISIAKSEIHQMEMEMHYSYLPILASPELQKKIEDLKSCELRVRHDTTYVPLNTLTLPHTSSRDPIESVFCKPYLSPSTTITEKTKYQWYWEDDYHDFQCCSEEVNRRFEQNFKVMPHLLQRIGRFDYIINFENMTQINIKTGKKRLLKREVVQSSEDLAIKLQIKSHESFISYWKSQIVSKLSSQVKKVNLEVPNSAIDTDSFQDLLNDIKKRFLKICSEGDQNITLIIEGKDIFVQTALSDLQHKILQIVAEKSFQVTTPNTWEKQSNKCELKQVMRGTSEWRNIEDKMLQPNFRVRIQKIERIQNLWLWELYQLSKKRMSEKNDGEVNEKSLFHGTRQTSPKDIYDSEQGFDNRLASQGLWGEGTYFAVSAKYSDNYAHTLDSGYKQMFLAQVVTGVSCQLNSSDRSLKAPPKKEDHPSLSTLLHISKFEGERYDMDLSLKGRDTTVLLATATIPKYTSYMNWGEFIQPT